MLHFTHERSIIGEFRRRKPDQDGPDMTGDLPAVAVVWTLLADLATQVSRVNVPVDMIRDRTGLDDSPNEEGVRSEIQLCL